MSAINVSIDRALQLALAHHRAGRMAEAEQIYRQILAQQPQCADPWHLLGVLAHQAGRSDAAVELIGKAIDLSPANATYHANLGEVFRVLGRFDEAIASNRRAIASNPDYADAHNNLGNALVGKALLDEAIGSYRSALARKPDFAEAHNNLGYALLAQGRFDEAIKSLQQALTIKPDYPDAHNNLGSALAGKGLFGEAIGSYRQVLALRPDYAEAHSNLGNALSKKGLFDEAIMCHRRALQLKPALGEAHSNLGNALAGKELYDEAIASYQRGLAIAPKHIEAYNNLGLALQAKGLLEEAAAAYQSALAIHPEYAEAHFNLGLTLLTQGDLGRGLAEYEWRWKCKDNPPRTFAQPRWDGGPLDGRTILLYAEQGFGDVLQFVRYVPLVRQRGGRIILECHPELLGLLKGMAGVEQCVARGDALPSFDVHCPLVSLPLMMGTTLETIPATVPYLAAEERAVKSWAQRLDDAQAALKVGLAWAGNPAFKNDRPRSPRHLSLLAPLADVQNVQFYSLQKGDAGKQAKSPPAGMRLIDWTEDLHDFADTAALIANLDLVISSDTAVAHLAGAMGKPLWVMLPFMPDWRWLLNRTESPWYPTARLFRQPTIGDWETVTRQVAAAIREIAAANSTGPTKTA